MLFRSVELKNSAELAQAIISLLGDDAMRQRMGQAGRERVISHFSPERQCEEVGKFYSKILNLKPFDYLDT